MGAKQTAVTVDAGDLQRFLELLHEHGYETVGPTVRDNAVVYDTVESVADLPQGWSEEQTNGRYRLTRSKRKSYFGYVHGPTTWKKFLYPPAREMYTAEREGSRFEVTPTDIEPRKLALIGVRACELAAIRIQDLVLIEGEYVDTQYRQRRRDALLVAVNCTRAGGTCFCVSMNTGPRVTEGYDILLTEMLDSRRHYFIVESGSDRGAEIVSRLPSTPATDAQLGDAAKAVDKAAGQMGRSLDVTGLKESLNKNFDHIHWEKVAGRCLTCGNCTMVCPTCFCMTLEDSTALTGEQAFRIRRWDTCFTVDFSYIHGGSIRATDYSRYRQWLMHKLAHWQDQFGVIGCVGCGRCITWCPVGIDITEEARAVQAPR